MKIFIYGYKHTLSGNYVEGILYPRANKDLLVLSCIHVPQTSNFNLLV